MKVKNKLVYIMISILIIIALAGTAFYFILSDNFSKDKEEPSIDEVIKYTVDIPEITTNLADGKYIKITFKMEANDKKAKKELEKRVFQVRDISIGLLADMNSKDVKGSEGQNYLKKTLMDKLNELMQDGEVVNIYITNNVLN